MDTTDVTELGNRLLELFREQQATHSNIGCKCPGCREDMVKALKALAKEGEFSITQKRAI